MRSNRSPLTPPPLPFAARDHNAFPPDRLRQPKRFPVVPFVLAALAIVIVAIAATVVFVRFGLSPDRLAAVLQQPPATARAQAAVSSPAPPVAAATTPAPAPKPAPTSAPTSAPTQVSAQPSAPTAAPRSGDRFTHAFALWRMLTYSLMDDAPDQPQPFQQMRQMSGDLQYVDGGAFHTEDVLVRLSGISSLPREAVCIGDNKAKFACGLMARASLSLLVSPERPRCYPDVSLATTEPAWLCTSRGRLLSAAQIEAGFALPSQPSVERYADLASQARAARVGAWNGDWTIAAVAGVGSP